MAISQKQREREHRICKCGCGGTFSPFPVYRKKSEGGGLRYSEYMVGHNPAIKSTQFGKKPPWNKGLTKQVCPTLSRMGFQRGHRPYTDWSRVNERLRNDPKLRRLWLEQKRGKTPWNKGKTKEQYPHGIKSGPEHGNWAGGLGGVQDTAAYQDFRRSIYERDSYTCQLCDDRNHQGRGSRIQLQVHHLVPVCEDASRIMDPTNVITVCLQCHHKTDTFGSKAGLKLRDGKKKRPNRIQEERGCET